MRSIDDRNRQAGYNLVEVLIAIALLGVVIISLTTLFSLGQKNVYSGRQMTTAIAIGTQVLEDLAPLNKQMIYNGLFNLADTATGTDYVVNGGPAQSCEGCLIRSTWSGLSTTPTIPAATLITERTTAGAPLLLTKWAKLLGNTTPGTTRSHARLNNGSITLLLIPQVDPVNDPPRLGDARMLRVRVLIRWAEGRRQRELVLETLKSN
jgi:prepilin-type N-terminal cleavage/methylation domain-containing protein